MAKPAATAQSGSARALIFLVLALVAGAAATIMVYQLIQSYQMKIAEAQKPEETVKAVVAAGDLFPGLVITEQDLVQVDIPKKFLPDDAFTSPELVVGRIPRERILANEFVRPGRLADGDAGIGLNALVPEGMRAISINVHDAAQVSGFLQPGNLVDVLVTIIGEQQGDIPETTTLLQAIPVLAVNNRLLKAEQAVDPKDPKAKTEKRKGAPSVTLAVTPEQAEQVAHASKQGTITLTLRNNIDFQNQTVDSVDSQDVLGQEPEPDEPKPVAKKKAPVKQADPTSNLQIITGGQKQQVQYGSDGQIKQR